MYSHPQQHKHDEKKKRNIKLSVAIFKVRPFLKLRPTAVKFYTRKNISTHISHIEALLSVEIIITLSLPCSSSTSKSSSSKKWEVSENRIIVVFSSFTFLSSVVVNLEILNKYWVFLIALLSSDYLRQPYPNGS